MWAAAWCDSSNWNSGLDGVSHRLSITALTMSTRLSGQALSKSKCGAAQWLLFDNLSVLAEIVFRSCSQSWLATKSAEAGVVDSLCHRLVMEHRRAFLLCSLSCNDDSMRLRSKGDSPNRFFFPQESISERCSIFTGPTSVMQLRNGDIPGGSEVWLLVAGRSGKSLCVSVCVLIGGVSVEVVV